MASPTAAPGKYPKQLVIMVDTETHERISTDAAKHELSKSEVARLYLTNGIADADRIAREGVYADPLEVDARADLENARA